MLDVFEVEKVLPQFRFADLVRRLMIMCGQLAHGSAYTPPEFAPPDRGVADTRSFSFVVRSWLHLQK